MPSTTCSLVSTPPEGGGLRGERGALRDGLVAPALSAPALEALQGRLGYRFRDRGLLRLALAHRSWCAEAPGEASNERLEFLGDAVLGLVVTRHIFLTYPELAEGELAKLRAAVVNAEVLAEVAAELDLGSVILLGRGEDASGGREKPSILADATEAVLGAVYLDGDWPSADTLIRRLLATRIEAAATGPGGQDYKTRLQEVLAQRGLGLPAYVVSESGPDHAKQFRATVLVAGSPAGAGEGRSKKQAEQAAARSGWESLVVAASPEAGHASPEAGGEETEAGGEEAEAARAP